MPSPSPEPTVTDLSAGRRSAPSRLVLVRHGESLGNVADREAQDAGAHRLELDTRDADTPLSDVGRQQALAVGAWLRERPRAEWPAIVVSSPYARAHETAELVVSALDADLPISVDERLRERDLGLFDGLTGAGIRDRYPDEAARRQKIGKFYYRPPCGESWTDVVLRVRSALADVRAEYPDAAVWLFSHQAVIMSFRYVLESMDESTVLEIDGSTPLANCSLTSYRRDDGGGLVLEEYASTEAVDRAPTTHEAPHGGANPDD